MELGEGVVMRRTLNPDVVDPDFLVRLQIVVNDHSPRADNCHLTNFAGSSQLLWMVANSSGGM